MFKVVSLLLIIEVYSKKNQGVKVGHKTKIYRD